MKRDAIRWIVFFAAVKLLFHLWSNGLYGFHRDELATLDDARHLAWGYVAYPPLTPFLGRIELALFGATPAGFRFLASLAQAIAIVVTAMMAKRLGGGRAAQWIAALAVAIAPISLAASALFQYVAFDFLWWVLIAYFVVRLVESDDPRWWMAIGTVIGLGALTKYTIAFCIAGIVAGVLATDLRRHLRSRWLWIGAAISIAIALPHLLWEASHGFVTLDFVRHVHARDMRIGRTQDFLLDQLRVASNPVTLPLWIVGLIAVLQSPRFRILAWMALVPFALFFLAQGRGYYTGPLYPGPLRGGIGDRRAARRGARARRLCSSGAAVRHRVRRRADRRPAGAAVDAVFQGRKQHQQRPSGGDRLAGDGTRGGSNPGLAFSRRARAFPRRSAPITGKPGRSASMEARRC